MNTSKTFTSILTLLLVTAFYAQAQFVGPSPLVVPGDNYAFAYSTDGTVSGLTNFGLYFDETGTTPGFQFTNGSGAKLVNIQSITKGNREPGDITFGATGSLIINPNRYAFRFSLTNSYGLFFNAAGFAYEFRTADASPVFSIGANSGDMTIGNQLTFAQNMAIRAVDDGGGCSNRIEFVKDNNAADMVFTNCGNVGIGTVSPNAALVVQGNNGGENQIRSMLTNGDYISLQRNDANAVLHTNNGEPLLLNHTGGNVGIGTTTPGTKLEVRGQIRASTSSGDIVQMHRNAANAVLYANNGEPLLLQHLGGNVGIGTTSPTTKLTVKGTITCSELNVVDISTIPDYVFKEDYKLMSLEEVSDFIDENGHLPNIPNEAQVQQEGLKLAELNLKLLEKIEELTLHMIEKDEEIKQIQQQLVELKSDHH